MLQAHCTLNQRQAIIPVSLTAPSPDGANKPGFTEYRALIDTGAQRSALTPRVIQEQNLQFFGRRLVRTVDTEESYRLVLVSLAIYGKEPGEPHGALRPFVLPQPIEPFAARINHNIYDMLLGMDVLEYFNWRFAPGHGLEIDLK